MNKQKGYIELKLGGKTRGLKFGVGAFMIFCEIRKIEFQDMLDVFINGKYDISVTCDMMYGAALHNCRVKGDDADFNRDQFFDFIDEFGWSDATTKVMEMITSVFPVEEKGAKKKVPTTARK